MGVGKKEATRKQRQGRTGDGMGNIKVKGENFYRDAKKLKALNILKEGKPIRDKYGNITQAASYQSREIPNARIEPNRKWFTNSRVISQQSLSSFRDAVAQQANDPFSFLLKTNKLPMSLIRDDETKTKNGIKQHKAKMVVETQSFGDTFGPKAQRKRVKLGQDTFASLAGDSAKQHGDYLDRLEQAKLLSGQLGQTVAGEQPSEHAENPGDDASAGILNVARESIFTKGQSRRIWNELYKVIDSSDVIVHVLDARDPLGTRCRAVEKYLKDEAPHKHLVFILNKCDLVPTSVAANWVKTLSTEFPTLAFHASITNSFGKGSLISLLRQFAVLHSDRKQVSCGFIGYPNTGKSSIINTLRKKVVCKTAPIPGETKVWQYITLTRRIYLIDCPGVVPPNPNDTEAEILLRGVVRVEAVENPAQYVEAALGRCQPRHVERTYGIKGWTDAENFLEMLARKSGRLLKGGEADHDGVARTVLNDFLRGRIPWFVAPPPREGGVAVVSEGIDANGNKSKKRKREEIEAEVKSGAKAVAGTIAGGITAGVDEDDEDDDEGSDEASDFAGLDDSADLIVDPSAIGILDGGELDGESGSDVGSDLADLEMVDGLDGVDDDDDEDSDDSAEGGASLLEVHPVQKQSIASDGLSKKRRMKR